MAQSAVLAAAIAGAASSAFALGAVATRDLLRAVALFALSSACLAATFFLLGAPFAGALELTVGAGLVSVLFLVALVLVGGREVEAS